LRSIGILPILILILAACTPARQTIQPWQLSDLRLLELPNTADPTSDLIAIYTRQIDNDFQIRLDILDLQPDFDINFYILLDTTASGIQSKFSIAPPAISSLITNQRWDILLSFPHNGYPQAFLTDNFLPKPILFPRIQHDPLLDTVTISFDRNILSIPKNLTFQIFLTTPDGKIILDQSPPISNMLSNPIPTAPLIIAFSDSFPAFTPAQALRRWDGAHTGPTGERHGLKHILTNSEIYNIPVVLLDLKYPTSISALDFIDAIPQVQSLVRHNLLLLPDVIFATPDDLNLLSNQSIASSFGFPVSNFVYSTDGQLQASHRLQFVNLPDRSHLLRQAGITLIPLPDLSHNNAPIQASNEGLSLEVRRQLLATALSSDPKDLVILGGSLPYSTWGDSDMSMASMAYIAAHPWIQPLNANQIQSFYTQPIYTKYEPRSLTLPSYTIFTSLGSPTGLDSIHLQAQILRNLQISPRNTITNLAWQMFFSLTSPSTNPVYSHLQYQYLNQVESLLTASRWVESPTTNSDCSQDIDLDSINECVLSNPNYFAIIETDGGRLSFLFARNGNQVHQLIGPLSQFFVGLSDPSLWHIQQGPAADPAEIPGAFSDSDNPFINYKIIAVEAGLLNLNRSDGQIDKVFRLVENGLSIDLISRSAVSIKIPLAIDPQVRFHPGWKKLYYSKTSMDSFKWGVLGSTSVEIMSIATISAHDFYESASLLNKPENPDLDYPPGHFLPFPFALIDISGMGPFSANILIQQ